MRRRADIERGIEALVLDEWIRLRRDGAYDEVRREMYSRDGLNRGFVRSGGQANGAVPVAIPAIFVNVRA